MISTDVFGSSDEVGSSASSRSGSLHQRARDAHALALAAGERIGAHVAILFGKPHGIEQLEGLATSASGYLRSQARAARSRAARTARSPSP
jgi:hypothetical protein